MFRKFVILSVAALFIASCSSKKKNPDSDTSGKTTTEDGVNTPDVNSKGMSFNPDGSDSGDIAGLSTVNFEYDKSRLTTSARKTLADNANWMKENKGVSVQIEGHCDERGSIEYNLSLGERRAKAVKRYLTSLGVDAKQLSIISYGKEKLLDRGDSEEAHARNRRANFLPLSQ